MPQKPPAFQFYAKDWRSSSTVRKMTPHLRGIYIDLLAAAWDSDEPGTLPLPIEVAARSAGLDPRSLRDFMAKSPRSFVEVESIPGRLVNEKLRSQYEEHCHFTEKQRLAGIKGNAVRWHRESQADRSASASASASANLKEQAAAKIPAALLPEWVPVDAWEGYVKMRQRIRRPMTLRAQELALKKLEQLMAEGHSPTSVLEWSIFNSYQGLFSPTEGKRGKRNEDPDERLRQAARNIGYNPKVAN